MELPFSRKRLLFVCGMIFLCVGVVKYILIPQYYSFSENKAKAAELQEKYLAWQELCESLPREMELAAETTEQLIEYEQLFNKVMDDGMAFVQIGLIAEETQVDIVSLTPGAVIEQTSYLEFFSRLEVRGSYHAIRSFIKRMEEFPNLTEIKIFKIAGEYKKEEELFGSPFPKPEITTGGLLEVFLPQGGKVKATLELVTYTGSYTVVEMNMEQAAAWADRQAAVLSRPGLD